MNQNSDLLKSGGYAVKQIFSNCTILRWSHQTRFNKGIELVTKLKPASIVDYGCGDATFLILLKLVVKRKLGLEIDTTQLELLKNRFKDENDFAFSHVSEALSQQFDVVTCFEVLEHCSDVNIAIVLERLDQLCLKGGTIIISVPKETGLTMVGKQLVRRWLGARKIGTYEYTERYTFIEFLKMLFATNNTKITRNFVEINYKGEKILTCGHKGFNWKVLRTAIQSKFNLQSVQFTPVILPYGLASSQVWFICKKL